MSITIPQDESAAKEAATPNGKPIPAGKYTATIVPTKRDGQTIEVVKAANSGANAEKLMLNVQFRLVDGQGHDNRRIFERIPLFTKWAPSGEPGAKYPDGAPAFLYYQFFSALGYDPNQAGGFTVPPLTDLLGKAVEIVVTVDEPDEYNPEGRNRVRFINKATTTADAVKPGEPAVSQELWATAGPSPAESPEGPWSGTPTTGDAPAWNPNGPTL